MVDCAEGTLRQFQTQPRRNNEPSLRANKVTKLFVTHMHADHVMGIVPFLRQILHPPSIDDAETSSSLKKLPSIEIYGPAGLRSFVRSVLSMTFSRTADTYTVHELLTPTCTRTSCDPTALHPSEYLGSDLVCAEDGFWRQIASARGHLGDVVVDAGPIMHRVPCLGYVFREPSFPRRKLAILGDTSDASSIIPLLTSPPPNLLVHEATDAHIPRSVDPHAKRSAEEVQRKVLGRGHSTPVMAGEFAKRVGAERLVLNHIGSRFPAPRQLQGAQDVRFSVIDEISRQASEAWGMGRAEVAFDYMKVSVPAEAGVDMDEEMESENGERRPLGMGGGRGIWRGGRGRGRGRGGEWGRPYDKRRP